MGAGVPVTLSQLNGDYIEPCPFVDKREQFSSKDEYEKFLRVAKSKNNERLYLLLQIICEHITSLSFRELWGSQ